MKQNHYCLAELAELTEAKLVGNPNVIIYGINTLEEAEENEASFLANSRYLLAMKKSKAGVICISPEISLLQDRNFLISKNPSSTFQQLVKLFYQDHSATSGFFGVHPSAIIHPTATLEEEVIVGPLTVIEEGVHIKKGSIIGPLVFLGRKVHIGENCILHANCTIRENCKIGNHVIIQPGAVIGSCGFGFTTTEDGKFCKLEQYGNVVIEDDVEIGANTTIDRARFKTTRICKGTKIDNLVHIAHNVTIGPNNAIAAQSGIAGSSKTGKNVLMGGQVGIVGHVTVGDCCMLATRTGVSKSLPPFGKYRGSPAMPFHKYQKQMIYIRRLESLMEKIEHLEKKVEEMEKRKVEN